MQFFFLSTFFINKSLFNSRSALHKQTKAEKLKTVLLNWNNTWCADVCWFGCSARIFLGLCSFLCFINCQHKQGGQAIYCFVRYNRKTHQRGTKVCVYMFILFRDRERWQQEKSGAREGGKESISSTPCSPQMNLSCSVIFSLSPSFFSPFPYSPAPSYIYCSWQSDALWAPTPH